MAHKLIGSSATFLRQVIVRPAFTRHREGFAPDQVPAEVKLVETSATIIGVEPGPAPRVEYDDNKKNPKFFYQKADGTEYEGAAPEGWENAQTGPDDGPYEVVEAGTDVPVLKNGCSRRGHCQWIQTPASESVRPLRRRSNFCSPE